MTEPNGGLDWSYESYLSQVPEALRTQIEPAFKSYSEKLQSDVSGQVGQFEPFKEIVDQGWTPEHVNVGLNLLQTLNDDPQRIYQALIQEHPELAQQFQPTPPVVQQTTPTDQNIDPALDQRLGQMDEMIQLLFQGYEQNQQKSLSAQQAMQEQQELAQFKATLDKVAPEDQYPRHFILSYVSQGQTPEQAVNSFNQWKTSELQTQRSAGSPLVAPAGGGGLPSEPIDTSKLSETARKDLIAQYLERANQNR